MNLQDLRITSYNVCYTKLLRLGLLHHRGPDHCGIVETRNCFFAHNRLSIIDLDTRSHQPLRHQNILLSFNGEIYNFKSLRDELDFPFESQGESEVLIAAYLKWGVDFVHHLRGMFAIALMDGDKLYLFRDRLGKKPLFYLHQNGSFAFASEIKALKPLLPQIRMNDDAMMGYLGFLAPTPPHTFYEGIFKLEAGWYLEFEAGHLTCKPYYDLLQMYRTPIVSETEALQFLETHLLEAISLRLEADVPMASLLSGGIDSALIAAVAKSQGRALQTFTLGYAEYGNYDERVITSYSIHYTKLYDRMIDTAADKINGTLIIFKW